MVAAGGVAALQVGKLPPALPALQAELGLSLVQSGFMLSMVQLAGLSLAVFMGMLADGMGLKRSMVRGLLLLALASGVGGLATSVPVLLVCRALEGMGLLLVALPAPALIRRLVPPAQLPGMLGLWGAYMPLATALALLAGPPWIAAFGWRSWWWLLGAVAAAAAIALARGVPASVDAIGAAGAPAASPTPWAARLAHTLGARGPWLVAVAFAMYSGQWLAVIGFLPTIYTAAGVSGAATGALSALVAAVNMAGNIAAGRLLHRGVRQPRLLAVGYVAMALAAVLAFAGGDGAAPAWLRYAALLAFSMLGGMIPATLFSLAVRLAPGEHTLSTTVGWVQQWSSFGQFAGPPLVAWVASRAGGWHWTWLATGACSLAGLALTAAIARTLRPPVSA